MLGRCGFDVWTAVVGGDGSSCAAQVLAEAWAHCPEACAECDINKRGCTAFSSCFMGSLSVFSYGSLMSGSLLYSAYFKKTPYRKLLFSVQVRLHREWSEAKMPTYTVRSGSDRGFWGSGLRRRLGNQCGGPYSVR